MHDDDFWADMWLIDTYDHLEAEAELNKKLEAERRARKEAERKARKVRSARANGTPTATDTDYEGVAYAVVFLALLGAVYLVVKFLVSVWLYVLFAGIVFIPIMAVIRIRGKQEKKPPKGKAKSGGYKRSMTDEEILQYAAECNRLDRN